MDIDLALSIALVRYRHAQKLSLAECLEKMGMGQTNPKIKPRINPDLAFEEIPTILTAIGTTIVIDYDIVNTLLNDTIVVFDQDMSVLADLQLVKQLFESVETFLNVEQTEEDYDLRVTLIKYFYQRMTRRADDEYKEYFVSYVVMRIYNLIPWGMKTPEGYDEYCYDCEEQPKKPYEEKNRDGKILMYIDVLIDLKWHITAENHVSILNLLLLVGLDDLLGRYQSTNLGERYHFFGEEHFMQRPP